MGHGRGQEPEMCPCPNCRAMTYGWFYEDRKRFCIVCGHKDPEEPDKLEKFKLAREEKNLAAKKDFTPDPSGEWWWRGGWWHW